MKKIFVTGGSGFIGSHLIAKLLVMGYAVTNYDVNSPSCNPDAVYIEGDIMNFDKLCKAMKNHEYVCHLAAMVGVVECQADPEKVLNVNYYGTKNVLHACLKNNVKHVLFASSSEVYGEGGLRNLLEEDSELKPLSPYGKSKMMAESLMEQHWQKNLCKSTTLRYCNIFGPMQRMDFLIPIFVQKVLRKEPLPVCDKGQQTRVFTYIDSAVNGTIQALFRSDNNYQVFNICSNDVFTVLEVAEKVLSLKKGTIKFLDYAKANRKSQYEIIHRIPSNKKAVDMLQYSPKINFDEGLDITFKYYESNLFFE